MDTEQKNAAEYNGWSNRETWIVNLWLTNDMVSYDYLQQLYRKRSETWEKAEELEVYYQDQLDELLVPPSIWIDILRTAMDRVDWYQVIESNLE